jgi:hypothetical protein
MNRSRHACALVPGLFLALAVARGQSAVLDERAVHSVSGQFLVASVPGATPLFQNPAIAANTNLVRLEPALLAVAAERFKISLWQQLGLNADAPWSGKIVLVLHPARSPDETVAIASSPFLNHWNYQVNLPDVLDKMRYARALSAVLLLEIANRTARPGGHSAEVPEWLVDGLARQLLAGGGEKVVLTAPPRKKDGGLPVDRLDRIERSVDPLATTRRVLQNAPALTFDQLSWPTDAQMTGADGGVYWASAQLFQSELLGLKNGREKMRTMLAELPRFYNWQTAFFHAFHENFQSPLEVEKWWALRVVNFAEHSAGPRWTTDVSRARLAAQLSVLVDERTSSNALPSHAEISLQDALKNLNPAQRDPMLRTKIRDLALIELQLAPPFGQLADGYRVALAGFLGGLQPPARAAIVNKHVSSRRLKVSLADTLKRLDALDRRFREAENRVSVPAPARPAAGAR